MKARDASASKNPGMYLHPCIKWTIWSPPSLKFTLKKQSGAGRGRVSLKIKSDGICFQDTSPIFKYCLLHFESIHSRSTQTSRNLANFQKPGKEKQFNSNLQKPGNGLEPTVPKWVPMGTPFWDLGPLWVPFLQFWVILGPLSQFWVPFDSSLFYNFGPPSFTILGPFGFPFTILGPLWVPFSQFWVPIEPPFHNFGSPWNLVAVGIPNMIYAYNISATLLGTFLTAVIHSSPKQVRRPHWSLVYDAFSNITRVQS